MPVTRPWIVAASAGAGLLLVVACSEDASLSVSGSAAPFPREGTAPGTDPSPPGRPGLESPCPGEAPADGSMCTSVTIAPDWDRTCEYGHDLDRRCNDVFTCDGRWQQQRRSSCFDRCPETFEAIVPGAPCSDPTVGCSYLEGTCACVVEQSDEQSDGGTPAADGGEPPAGRWRCAPPPGGGCPAQRPPVGADCVRPMVCDYGSCIIGRDVTFECLERRWLQADTRCADGGGG